MDRRLASAMLITAALTSLASCNVEPQWTVTGVWVNSPIRTDSTIRLVLQQDGDSITGVACSDIGLTVLWTGASVEGQFPEFTFTVRPEHRASCCGNSPLTFAGKVFNQDKIFLYPVIDGELRPNPRELHRSSDQQYRCPPLSALR